MSLGVALSGGGIKGIAHLGVIKYLEENNVKIDYISGCSSGSIAAVLYACGYNSNEVYEACSKYLRHGLKGIFKYNIFNIGSIKRTMGLNNGNIIESIVRKMCMDKGIKDITDIKIPIFIPTVDLHTGKLIYFTNVGSIRYDNDYTYIYGGDIAKIVRASCSYPGIFSPKIIDKHLLVDGGLRDQTPVLPLKDMNVSQILAVTFNNIGHKNIDNIFSVIFQSFEILVYDNNYEATKQADYILQIDLEDVGLLDATKMSYIYEQGYLQTKEYLG